MCSSRRVSCPWGTIKLDGQTLFLSSALRGWSVGLKPISEQSKWKFGLDVCCLGRGGFGDERFYRADPPLKQNAKEWLQIRPNKTADGTGKV